MNQKISRWMQIVFWTEESDLKYLHLQENLLATPSGPANIERWRQAGMPSWMSYSVIDLMQDRYHLKPYWPKEMPNDESLERMRAFEREIYPIWMGIESRYQESDRSEREVTHMCDLAIVASGKHPDRAYYNPGEIDRLRKKSMAGDKFNRWSK